MVKDKNTQIELANKRTLHNTIYVKQKEINFSDDVVMRNQPVIANSGILLDNPSCLTESFQRINHELKKVNSLLNDFLLAVNNDFS